jgi:hypothetical protein
MYVQIVPATSSKTTPPITVQTSQRRDRKDGTANTTTTATTNARKSADDRSEPRVV